ncbi:response regulator [uncultured Thiohalocapsa sp.]|uniref:response regulator n=1 Tax=uncultured Thiohalocapsa sp. TaxID=768990 RepID=UPI0025E4629D|nr:response regulator [uncultured Thiohalocapsa sp.]
MTTAATRAAARRIQVLDDDPRLLRASLLLLPRWGFRCETYTHARDALAAIQRNPPDLLIVDIYMPDLDGFEVIARARQLAPSMPILAVSGDIIQGEATNVLAMGAALGADATLHKPFRPEALRASLEALVGVPAPPQPGGPD